MGGGAGTAAAILQWNPSSKTTSTSGKTELEEEARQSNLDRIKTPFIQYSGQTEVEESNLNSLELKLERTLEVAPEAI